MTHYIYYYKNVIVFPSVFDVDFKTCLIKYLISLEQDYWYILLFYTYTTEVIPLKRRGGCLISRGCFYCSVYYDSSLSFDDIYTHIKESFVEKRNFLENDENYFLTSEDSCYGYRWIDINQISFVKIWGMGYIENKSIISGSDGKDNMNDDVEVDMFTINSNDYNFYNKSKGVFSKGINYINYNKALLCSVNGIRLKKCKILGGSVMKLGKQPA